MSLPSPPDAMQELEARVAAAARRTTVIAAVLGAVLVGLVTTAVAMMMTAPGREPTKSGPPIDASAGEPPPAIDAPAPCVSGEDCRLACQRDHRPDDCLRSADLVRTGSDQARGDLGAAIAEYRTLCAGGDGDALACTRLALIGGLLLDRDVAPDWFDEAHAPKALLGRACERGDARGSLACAALVVMNLDGGGEPRAHLCARFTGDGMTPKVCARRVAATECFADGTPESCWLAGDTTALATTCKGDPVACYYLAVGESGDQRMSHLVAACNEGAPRGVAQACRALAAGATPARRKQLLDRSCALGDCEGASAASLDAHCPASLDACAHLLSAAPGSSLQAIAARVPDHADLLDRIPDTGDAKLTGPLRACSLGAASACEMLAGTANRPARVAPPLDATLRAYAARLRDPFGQGK